MVRIPREKLLDMIDSHYDTFLMYAQKHLSRPDQIRRVQEAGAIYRMSGRKILLENSGRWVNYGHYR